MYILYMCYIYFIYNIYIYIYIYIHICIYALYIHIYNPDDILILFLDLGTFRLIYFAFPPKNFPL